MDRGIFAVVEHRKLMELKNCGAVDADRLEGLARLRFSMLKEEIKEIRGRTDKDIGWFRKLVSLTMPIDKEVDLMFGTRKELVDHLSAVDVPTDLCPLTQTQKDEFLFIDRAAMYAVEARKILDMFKRHNEVIVNSDHSVVIDWLLQNSYKIREELAKEIV